MTLAGSLDIAGSVMMAAGIILLSITAIGLARLPDFFTRVHAVSKAETLGIALVLFGLIVIEGLSLASLKIALIAVFIGIANPVGAHVLTRAAVRSGTMPWTRASAPAPREEESA